MHSKAIAFSKAGPNILDYHSLIPKRSNEAAHPIPVLLERLTNEYPPIAAIVNSLPILAASNHVLKNGMCPDIDPRKLIDDLNLV